MSVAPLSVPRVVRHRAQSPIDLGLLSSVFPGESVKTLQPEPCAYILAVAQEAMNLPAGAVTPQHLMRATVRAIGNYDAERSDIALASMALLAYGLADPGDRSLVRAHLNAITHAFFVRENDKNAGGGVKTAGPRSCYRL